MDFEAAILVVIDAWFEYVLRFAHYAPPVMFLCSASLFVMAIIEVRRAGK